MTNEKAIEIIELQVEGLQPFADIPATAEVIEALNMSIKTLMMDSICMQAAIAIKDMLKAKGDTRDES